MSNKIRDAICKIDNEFIIMEAWRYEKIVEKGKI